MSTDLIILHLCCNSSYNKSILRKLKIKKNSILSQVCMLALSICVKIARDFFQLKL